MSELSKYPAPAAPAPDAVADWRTYSPLARRVHQGAHSADLQLYCAPPGVIRWPPARDHVLVLTLGGKGYVEDLSDGETWRGWIEPGSFNLSPAGHPVIRSWKGRPEVLILFLDPKGVNGVADELGLATSERRLPTCLAARDGLLHEFGAILKSEITAPSRGSELIVDSLIHAATAQLLRRHAGVGARERVSEPSLPTARMRRVVNYMAAHLDQPVSLAECADLCGLSITQFTRAFRAATRTSPHAYLVGLRLELARNLLASTDLRVTEIAHRCGFDQSQHFATAFRQRVGFSPSAWRSAHQ